MIGDLEPADLIRDLDIAPGDYALLEGEEVKITDLRELVRWLNLKPLAGGSSVKLAVIKNIDRIPAQSASTLLKTLEEPPAYAKIILTATDEQRILPTIHSRCQKLRVMAGQAKVSDKYVPAETIQKMSVKEKFDWVAQISELPKPEIENILTLWQMDFRKLLLAGQNRVDILKQIAQAKDLIRTNISTKLLLENLFLSF